jgi:hypothetical protein
MLQATVRFPIRSPNFSIDLILPAALWPWAHDQLLQSKSWPLESQTTWSIPSDENTGVSFVSLGFCNLCVFHSTYIYIYIYNHVFKHPVALLYSTCFYTIMQLFISPVRIIFTINTICFGPKRPSSSVPLCQTCYTNSCIIDGKTSCTYTKWFKYDRDWFFFKKP